MNLTPREATALQTGPRRRRPPRPRPERDVQAAILDLLNLLPWVTARRHNVGAAHYAGPRRHRFVRYGTPGTPDITGWIVAYLGRRPLALALGIEVKRADGVVRPEQAAYLQQLDGDGGVAILARSVDDVVAEFRRRGLWTESGAPPTLGGERG